MDIFDAIRQEDKEMVNIIMNGTNNQTHKRNKGGYTPLILATYLGQKRITKLLLRAKVNIDAMDNSGNTALMGVCYKGYEDIARLLIEAGADVNAINYNNATALIYAATFNRPKLALLLLENGANPNIIDLHGISASGHARNQGLYDLAEMIEGFQLGKGR